MGWEIFLFSSFNLSNLSKNFFEKINLPLISHLSHFKMQRGKIPLVMSLQY